MSPEELELWAHRFAWGVAEKIARKSKTFDSYSEIAKRLMPAILQELTHACEHANDWRKK